MSATVKLEEIDFEFLPVIYDIIRSIEKEMNEGAGGQRAGPRDQAEVHTKLQMLTEKFKKAKEKLMLVEGIDATREQQLKDLDILNKQLEMKRQLLAQYKNFSLIDSPFQSS